MCYDCDDARSQRAETEAPIIRQAVMAERKRIRDLLVGMQDNVEWIEERLDDLIEKLGLTHAS